MAEASLSDPAVPDTAPLVRPSHSSPARDFWTVCAYEFRTLLLSARTLAPMLIYAGFAALAVYLYVRGADETRADALATLGPTSTQKLDEASREMTKHLLGGIGWATDEDVTAIFNAKIPLMLIYFFAGASYFLPLLVALTTFDQFSELSTRGARYALLRVRRGTYFAGKATAAVGSVAVFLLVMWLIVTAVAIHHEGTEAASAAIREGLRGWAFMTLLALPYLSITAYISSWVTPGYAFLLTLGAWVMMGIGSALVNHVIPWLLTEAGSPSLGDKERHLMVLFPWTHAPKLISRDGATLASGAGALLLLAAIGYLLAYFNVRRRDV